jgi:sulfatase maturation enzyme AslB (radical SAM superfamily)
VLALIDRIAATRELDTFLYVATNGVFSEATAAWLARTFDLVGLSCDGPAAIHDHQRPHPNGAGSLRILERTAHILVEEGCQVHVRATITAATLHRQTEIAEYLCHQLAPAEIHFEPVYLGGRADDDALLGADQADAFVTSFLDARSVADSYGVPLLTSGSRLGSIHGPFCNVFRQVLNLVPGNGPPGRDPDGATACFKAVDYRQARNRSMDIGSLESPGQGFEIDYLRVRSLRQQLGALPVACQTCFNSFHCARGCPDHCPLDGPADRSADPATGFRCHAQKALTTALLENSAERLWAHVLTGQAEEPNGVTIA